MSELFSQANVYKILIAIIILALGYMFNMILDTRHSLYLSNKAQEANARQWKRIGEAESNIEGLDHDIEWLKFIMSGGR